MMLFEFPLMLPSTAQMRQCANNVGVTWDPHSIIYIGSNVGYQDAPDGTDPVPLQDEMETTLGVRPSVADPPSWSGY